MRRITRTGAALSAAMIAALVLLVAAPAYAHNYLVTSNPEEGSTITELPAEFSVTTNDTLLDLSGDAGGFAIQITNDSGEYFGDGCFAIRDATLSTGAALGAAGDYRMEWQVVSADGHTISGEVGFDWQPDSSQTLSEGFTAPPACGGGTLDEATPEPDEASSSADAVSTVDASTVVLIASAIALVLVAAVAIFLISVRRKKTDDTND
ncbi:copper resistance CopC family protein [Salinibacterium sp. PAMC 21357]|uniref:copper resistance CopC family protein n=1 Tax=Salinibacterium sp. PAMC 21357 TaxID=1112215 RepID=UPI0002895F33|nr:copper resistance protein CopC [Salinibacterium sp. PAMC 21357]